MAADRCSGNRPLRADANDFLGARTAPPARAPAPAAERPLAPAAPRAMSADKVCGRWWAARAELLAHDLELAHTGSGLGFGLGRTLRPWPATPEPCLAVGGRRPHLQIASRRTAIIDLADGTDIP